MMWLTALVLGGIYALAATTRARSWPAPRTTAWLSGLAALVIALDTGIDQAAEERLSAHMIQHGLISLVAAPLLVAAAPIRLALGTLPRAEVRRLARVLHSRPLRVLAHPVAGLVCFVAVLAVVHLPAVYGRALQDPAVHAVEHAALFWSAIALWVPLIAADPVRRRVGAVGTVSVLVAAMCAMSAVGAALAGAGRVLYAPYGASAGALADQGMAGAAMWVGGMIVVLPALLGLAWRALATEERRQQVRDRRSDAAPGSLP